LNRQNETKSGKQNESEIKCSENKINKVACKTLKSKSWCLTPLQFVTSSQNVQNNTSSTILNTLFSFFIYKKNINLLFEWIIFFLWPDPFFEFILTNSLNRFWFLHVFHRVEYFHSGTSRFFSPLLKETLLKHDLELLSEIHWSIHVFLPWIWMIPFKKWLIKKLNPIRLCFSWKEHPKILVVDSVVMLSIFWKSTVRNGGKNNTYMQGIYTWVLHWFCWSN
jgi:hypothetical protein